MRGREGRRGEERGLLHERGCCSSRVITSISLTDDERHCWIASELLRGEWCIRGDVSSPTEEDVDRWDERKGSLPPPSIVVVDAKLTKARWFGWRNVDWVLLLSRFNHTEKRRYKCGMRTSTSLVTDVREVTPWGQSTISCHTYPCPWPNNSWSSRSEPTPFPGVSHRAAIFKL